MSALLYVANVIFLTAAAPLLALSVVAQHEVGPLVVTDAPTAGRILALERALQHAPGDWSSYVGLARLYQRAGSQAFSYDALRAFEQRVSPVASARIALALAYLEIGRNRDGLRVTLETEAACAAAGSRCSPSERARLEITEQLARRLVERGIDAREDPAGVERVWRSVLMPVGSPRTREHTREEPVR